jgi:hypothetical protein
MSHGSRNNQNTRIASLLLLVISYAFIVYTIFLWLKKVIYTQRHTDLESLGNEKKHVRIYI